MILHRDSPDTEPDEPEAHRSRSRRHFARMIESSASRRLSRPKLTLAACAVSGIVALLFVGSRMLLLATSWVAALPDQQIAFRDIELVPSTPSWIIGKELKILEEVREEARYPERISILNLNLKHLEQDFRRNPWIKDVTLVERSYRHLAVHLAYRAPKAIVLSTHPGVYSSVIDEEAVPLPPLDIDWIERTPRRRVRGFDRPLVEIHKVDYSVLPPVGVRWKKRGSPDGIEEIDKVVLGAAKLADFLSRTANGDAPGGIPIEFVRIWLPDEPGAPYTLEDDRKNLVKWGKAPGEEKPGELTSDDRWKMLLEYIKNHSPLEAKDPDRIEFTRGGAVLFRGKPHH